MWILGLKGLKVLKTAKLPKNDDNRETGIKIQCCYLKFSVVITFLSLQSIFM